MIKWLANKLLPYIVNSLQMEEGVVQTLKRVDRLERDSHPPLFSKDQLFKVHKRLEDLETKLFVDQFKGFKDYEGTD